MLPTITTPTTHQRRLGHCDSIHRWGFAGPKTWIILIPPMLGPTMGLGSVGKGAYYLDIGVPHTTYEEPR